MHVNLLLSVLPLLAHVSSSGSPVYGLMQPSANTAPPRPMHGPHLEHGDSVKTPLATPHTDPENLRQQRRRAQPPKGIQYPTPPVTLSSRSADASDPQHEDLQMLPVSQPFVVSAATVRGPVSSSLQEQLEAPSQRYPGSAGAVRGLLHGSKKPKDFPKCSSCRILRCNGDRTYCSGHCRQRRKLFVCDSRTVSRPVCVPSRFASPSDSGTDDPLAAPDYEARPPSPIGPFDTVTVTADAPYIGCAEIADRRTGCPASGTRANVFVIGSTEVLFTRCRVGYYIPECPYPLLPFGICECFYRDPFATDDRTSGLTPSQVVSRPCRTDELAAGAGVGGADGSPAADDVVVRPRGEFTDTWFSNFTEPGQEPGFEVAATAWAGPSSSNVSLRIFQGMIEPRFSNARVLRDGEAIAEDYVQDYTAGPPTAAQDYEREPIETEVYYQDDYADDYEYYYYGIALIA